MKISHRRIRWLTGHTMAWVFGSAVVVTGVCASLYLLHQVTILNAHLIKGDLTDGDRTLLVRVFLLASSVPILLSLVVLSPLWVVIMGRVAYGDLTDGEETTKGTFAPAQ